jgi:hypothetical protein
VPTAAPTRTQVPTPTADAIRAAHPPLPDVRDLWVRTTALEGKRLSLEGEVIWIRVASEGYGYELVEGGGGFFGFGGVEGTVYRTALQVRVATSDGSSKVVMVGYNDDLAGVYEGTVVRVFGQVLGTYEGENAFGGVVRLPIIEARLVDTLD